MVAYTRTVLLMLTSGLLFATPLNAQHESRDPHPRNDCRLAAQVLETGHPAPHYDWAIRVIRRCVETGGQTIANVWARPPHDSAALNSLYHASRTLRDARITDAVIRAAVNPSSPQLVRLNAIRVLMSHAVPIFLVSLEGLTPPESDSVRAILGGVSHVSIIDGAVPIGPQTVDRIEEALGRLSVDADARVARAAAYTLRQVSRRLRHAP